MNSAFHVIAVSAVLVFLIAAIGFFSSSETAFLLLPKIKFRQMVNEKMRHAKTAASLRSDMDSLLTVVLVGTNFVNTLASAIATALAVKVAGEHGVGIATLIITCAVTVFGQIIPKTYAAVRPEKTACSFAPVLMILKKIFYPVVWLFTKISGLANGIAGLFWKNDDEAITAEDLKTLIDVGENEGTLEKGESRMLGKIFKFSDLHAHDIMKHRSLVKGIPVDASQNAVVEIFRTSGCSRLPVYEKSLETIIGLIDYKSVLFNAAKNDAEDYVRSRMQNVLFVPETFTALELLSKFKQMHTDFAVVLDEQGCTAGIATMDDVMRVVFGRMTDENPTSDRAPESRIKIISPSEFIVPGDMKLDDVNSILKLHLESEEFSTLGGWLLEQFGVLPSVGEVCIKDSVLFGVEDQAQRRIVSVRIRKGVEGKTVPVRNK